jgi:ABC-type multidrug transport system fused ATPase/permease subunit
VRLRDLRSEIDWFRFLRLFDAGGLILDENRWDEKAGLRPDAVGSQVIDPARSARDKGDGQCWVTGKPSILQRQRWPAIFWPGYTAGLTGKRQRAASCSFKMISFSNINKQYGKRLLFVDASFQLNPGEKVGLVGPNGAGKTTLFRMVVGEESRDEVRERPRLYDFCMAAIETSA